MIGLKSLLVRSGAVDALIGMTRSRLRILMYHGVSAHCLQPEMLEKQLQYLRTRFECYWASEIPELLDGGKRPGRPPVVLTFDDGLLNNLTYAAPLLDRFGVKATFFAVSDLLDGRSMLWNHELLCRLLLAAAKVLPPPVPELGQDRQERYATARAFIEEVKNWDHERRVELLDELRTRQPDPGYEPWMLEKFQIMGAKELMSLPDIIEIGSHTRTHPILPTLDDDQARDEIQTSRRVLESILDRPVCTFCYPDGKISTRDERLAAEAYDVAVSVDEGLVDPQANRHRLRRIPASDNTRDFMIRLVRPTAGGASPVEMSEPMEARE